MKRWRLRHLSQAWNQWKWVVQKINSMSAADLAEMLEEARKKIAELEEALRDALQRLAKNEHFVAFGAINRMRNITYSRAWEKWQESAGDEARQAKMLKGAIRRMQNRLLSMAFEKWQHEANKLTKQEFLMMGALNRMRNIKLSQAWEKWQQDAEENRRLRKAMSGAMKRWRLRHLSQAWNQWKWVVQKINSMSAAELADKLDEALRRIRELEATIAKMEASHAEEIRCLSEGHHREIGTIRTAHDKEKQKIFEVNLEAIEEMKRTFELEKLAIIDEWQSKYAELEKELRATVRDLENLEREMENLKKSHEKEKATLIKECELKIESVRAELEAAQRQIEKDRVEIERLGGCVEELEQQNRSLMEELMDAKRKLEEHGRELERLRRQHAQEKEAIEKECEMKIQDLTRTCEMEKEEIVRECEQKCRTLEQELENANDEIRRLKADLDRVKQEAEAKYAALIAQVEEITGQKVTVEDYLSIEKTAASALKSEVERLKAELERLRLLVDESAEFRQRIQELEEQLFMAQRTIAGLNEQIRSLEEEAARRYAQLSEEIERITGVKITVEGNLEGERSVTHNLREEIERLLRTIGDLTAIAEASDMRLRRINELEAEIKRLQGQVRGLELNRGTFSQEWEAVIGAEHHTVQPSLSRPVPGDRVSQSAFSPPTSPKSERKQRADLLSPRHRGI